MFHNEPDNKEKAARVAAYLSNHNNFKSHGRRVGLKQIRETTELNPLKVTDMNDRRELKNRVRDLFYAISITFDKTEAIKLLENSVGRRYVRHVSQRTVAVPFPIPPGSQRQEGHRRITLRDRIRSWMRRQR